ncbi:hypothetical protein ACIA6C_32235 [Streptomyces sp. NPDC051578]|uniref:hypothetical protein n=1 Tax=Streptomyces sp. NPDC051578 TaxID=3365662 RepID=UPI00378E1008
MAMMEETDVVPVYSTYCQPYLSRLPRFLRGPHRFRTPHPRPRRYTPPDPALRQFLAS